ncbi:ribosomal protein L15/L10-like protein [Scheffersomyces stipitis CBS 6054]|uniref:Ribosomal protein L15/L10-like protein n=1 Tax=Scheffersomyces stipitis (strain ATCC 58785 / CBS 6054 / NBRC 10063 / NRRL Y-11545) TaxID=322104 RepID=A3GG65_PICST|nr:mitochondrial 54S ribosomal protein YmL10/YmL18 [Scheffersomyces stipitis CBS 6054]EAZ63883.2 ribosomal protein L15/L10-like protein [Scheffersomyces stipitis CBS 6054]
MFGIGQGLKARVMSGVSFLTASRQTSYLGHLKPNEGAVVSYKRLGRGPASGKGKTSGRGQKGQKARGKVPRWLEGGQTPFYKRFPIIGFKRPHRRVYHEVNLARIQDLWNTGRIPLKEGETLTIKTMKECGLLTGTLKDGVKILANGVEDYNVPLSIEASRASSHAIEAIEALGHNFTARYFTTLGLKAHIYPDLFLLKKGYVPLQARPTHRRDIEYYSSAAKRGYLLKDTSLLLDHLKGNKVNKKAQLRQSALEKQLETASSKKYSDESRLVSLADLLGDRPCK